MAACMRYLGEVRLLGAFWLFLYGLSVGQVTKTLKNSNACIDGFRNLSTISLNENVTFLPEGDYIFPELEFFCNGTITRFNTSIFLGVGYSFSPTTDFQLKLWQYNGTGYTERMAHNFRVTTNVDNNQVLEPSQPQLLPLSFNLNLNSNISVVAGDILGVSPVAMQSRCTLEFPPGRITCRVIELVHGAPIAIVEDDLSGQPVLLQGGPCWEPEVGMRPCSVLHMMGRPYFEVDFEPSSSLQTHSLPELTNVPTTSIFDNLGIATVVVIALALVFALGVCVLSLVVICLCCCVCKQRRRSKGISSSGLSVHFEAMNGNSAEDGVTVEEAGNSRVHRPQRLSFTKRLKSNRYNQLSFEDHEGFSAVRDEYESKHKGQRSFEMGTHEYDQPSLVLGGLPSIVENKVLVYATASPRQDGYQQLDKRASKLSSVPHSHNSPYLEVSRSSIAMGHVLGEGEFGTVFYATWNRAGKPLNVAVKVCNENCGAAEKEKLVEEAAIIGNFNHERVVRLHGVVTLSEPNMLVMEYVQRGTLESHLHRCQEYSSQSNDDIPRRFLRFCHEIADGMRYLAHKGFVHRDLAARNILLDKDYHCKIADFGLTRQLEESHYYATKGGRVPLRWTPPEAILYNKFSTMGDVWTFGIVMYEIWSLGEMPYRDLTVDEIVHLYVRSGYCLPPPPGCPREIYKIMVNCWNPDHHKRPNFRDLFIGLSSSYQDVLLSWSEEDRSVSPQADVLGAPLEEGENLYRDLQFLYSQSP